MTVAVSTYIGEPLPGRNFEEFSFIRVSDPGPDTSRTMGRTKSADRNTSRMIECTIAGLRQVKTDYVVKSRVELLPMSHAFENEVPSILSEMETKQELLIAFLGTHYQGLTRDVKNAFLWIPDTFQIMRTSQALDLWEGAQKYWEAHRSDWMNQRKMISNEQILGLSLARMVGRELSQKTIVNFSKSKLNKEIYNAQKELEHRHTFLLNTISLGFHESRISLIGLGHLKRSNILAQKFANAVYGTQNYPLIKIVHESKIIMRKLNVARSKVKFLQKRYWKSYYKYQK